MAHRIVLEKDYGDMRKGIVHIVTSTKIAELKKEKIKYTLRLKSGTGSRMYEFEKPKKENQEEKNKD